MISKGFTRIAGAACLLMTAGQANGRGLHLDAAKTKHLDTALGEGITAGNTIGAAMAIMSDGRIIYSRAVGMENLETRTPMTPDTVFRIASITKQFTAASILLLQERGQLSIDDRLSRFLPDFPHADTITLHQLLNHTSGLRDYADLTSFWLGDARRDVSTKEFVEYIAHLDPLFDFAPGTAFNYSNSGYYLLGAVIEKVSGKSLQQFFKSELLDKAGMTHTAVDSAADIVPNRASGYERLPGTKQWINAPFISMSTVGANGSIRSTVGDLLRWHDALLRGKVVSPTSVKLMMTPGRLSDGRLASTEREWNLPPEKRSKAPAERDYGMGLNIERSGGFEMIAHEGGIPGFRSRLATYPNEQVSVAFMTNTGAGIANVPKVVETLLAKWMAREKAGSRTR